MRVISDTTEFIIQESVTAVTIGKFDGLHLGHRKIFQKLRERAAAIGGKTVVFTFAQSPYQRLSDTYEGEIRTGEERRRILEEIGIDYLVECPFTEEVMRMQPEDFVKKMLVERCHAAAIVVGEDFHFGYKRQGNIVLLERMAEDMQYQFVPVSKEVAWDAEQGQAREISSTWIRSLLKAGDLIQATRLLGQPYEVIGEIFHGKKLGRQMGMPTMNQHPEADKLLPPHGVYGTKVTVDGVCYPGVTNIGVRPTVASDDKRITVETHLVGFTGDLYGRILTVDFLQFIRPEMRFETLEQLSRQMRADRCRAEEIYASFAEEAGSIL